MPMYRLSVETVLGRLDSHSKRGLTSQQVSASRVRHGANVLPQPRGKSAWKMLLVYFFSPVDFILYTAFAISVISGEWVDAAVVLFILFGNASLGFAVEWRSEKALAALMHKSLLRALVVRNGVSRVIPLEDLVVGDLIILKQGYQVPADARLIQAENLQVDEALLTGEAQPALKHTRPIPITEEGNDVATPLTASECTNMVFRQTTVIAGVGVAVVTATGYNTRVGRVCRSLERNVSTPTAMQRTMNRFFLVAFIAMCLVIVTILSITGFALHRESTLYACAAGVALLPESLLSTVTVTLSLGVLKLSRAGAIVRQLQSVELLGCVTNICADKTGTLTEGRVVVRRVWPATSPFVYHVAGAPTETSASFGIERLPTSLISVMEKTRKEEPFAPFMPLDEAIVDTLSPSTAPLAVRRACEEIAMVAALCNNSHTNVLVDSESDTNRLIGTGSPIELALAALTYKLCLPRSHFEAEGWHLCGQWAFTFASKCMSVGVIRESKGKKECLILTKGSPDVVIPMCKDVDVDALQARAYYLTSRGFTVMAFAIGDHIPLDHEEGKRLHDFPRTQVEANLRFVGLCSMLDPPRRESALCIEKCHDAHISFHMLTGDQRRTAENIARRVHILRPKDGGDRIITGEALENLSDDEVDNLAAFPLVIAGCTPSSKAKVVQALHRRGRVVAMTGDGLNDAPAMVMADVGAAMGRTGVDATKNAADIILADDNIATLVAAVEVGRHVAATVRRFLVLLLTCNIVDLVVLLVGLVVKDDYGAIVFPMSPLEILWYNLFTCTPPAVGLWFEPIDPQMMRERPTKGSIFSTQVLVDALVYGILGSICLFLSYFPILYLCSWSWEASDGIGYNCNHPGGALTCVHQWQARSTLFVTRNILIFCHGYVCRHPLLSLASQPLTNNKVLLGSLLTGTVILLPILYIPCVAHQFFHHEAITWQWFVVALCVVLFLLSTEAYKYMKRKYGFALPEGYEQQFSSEDSRTGRQPGSRPQVAIPAPAAVAITNTATAPRAPVATSRGSIAMPAAIVATVATGTTSTASMATDAATGTGNRTTSSTGAVAATTLGSQSQPMGPATTGDVGRIELQPMSRHMALPQRSMGPSPNATRNVGASTISKPLDSGNVPISHHQQSHGQSLVSSKELSQWEAPPARERDPLFSTKEQLSDSV